MGTFIRLVEYKSCEKKEREFSNENNWHLIDEKQFLSGPKSAYIYWLGNRDVFSFDDLSSMFESGGRNKTHNNEKYVRCWWEVEDLERWQTYENGGEYRKWIGNCLDVVDWSEGAKQEYQSHGGLYNQRFAGRKGISWNLISSQRNCFRFKEEVVHYSSGSPTIFHTRDISLYVILGFLNSVVAQYLLRMLNPTMNTTVNDVLALPICAENEEIIDELSKECVVISKQDWNSFEIARDFCVNPLIKGAIMGKRIEDKYLEWSRLSEDRFERLKENEKKINQIFINLYGLGAELSSEVADDNITIRKAELQREIKSLISYAVGCIMGRYSLLEEGLVYAGGKWDLSRYSADFSPCEYGVLPITENQFFEEDLCTRVIDFIRVVYGEDTLNENLKFIASALKPESYEAPKKIIREYLFNDFFDNHYQVYQHKPIYWQLDSGKAGGFRAIVYMHRYNENTLPLVRTEFIQDLRYKYEEEMQRLKSRLEGASTTAESNAIKKDIAALDKKIVECVAYDELLNHATSSIQNYLFDPDDGVKTNYAKFLSIDGDKNSNILTVVKL